MFLAEGILEKTASFISDARRAGTIHHYELFWRKSDSGCNKQGLDFIRCDLNCILEFFTQMFNQGLKYDTICGYTSVIFPYDDSTGPFSVGKRLLFTSIMTGIF